MQIVYWLAKEALGRRSMQIDGDDMIDAGNREEIGYQTCGDGASVGLLLRLSGVEKVP